MSVVMQKRSFNIRVGNTGNHVTDTKSGKKDRKTSVGMSAVVWESPAQDIIYQWMKKIHTERDYPDCP